ncbi:winged helix-turn-helix transcriptional regulator [Sulfuracidifex tepidarius]|uniref:HTH-type transcriptional regulator Ptr2 n=1 Tax=Sulfuracidifex tepidarius TaxID=1294262 RepID=A0A510E062_9CREN|nr:winged helix-turn-helix transcriptional regulator [Sulfuracidifex tepidarius]BBG22803.1 HTH-type transcriptional regulator Ptr2 [Sulfuracidifex tepidarius]BBG25580.1 HTH-type transcriptional regulator Ptr2 [Sulfuracidifex tepidarius]
MVILDLIDKKLIFYLFKDGRMSQRSIANELGLTAPSLNYRYKKLEEDGVIKGFKLYLNPNINFKYQMFIAFKNYDDFSANWISFKLKCVEWLNVYNIIGDSLPDLKDKVGQMTSKLGEPAMSYLPVQSMIKISSLSRKIIDYLAEDPRRPLSEVSERLKVNTKTVERHVKYLIYKGIIMIIPMIDLPKADVVMFSMFSKQIDSLDDVLQRCKVWKFSDGTAGVTTCVSENMELAKRFIDASRRVDPKADVMIVYDYEFN